jgi:hypothetical protein
MNATLQKQLCDCKVGNRRYNATDGIDFVDKLVRVGIGRTPLGLGNRLRSLRVNIGYANQLYVRHVAIDSCMEATEITDADDPDA